MKNRKLIAGLAVLGVIVVSSAAYFGLAGDKKVGLLEEDAFRASADISNETVAYLDSEAIALSNASDSDTGLRSEALEAYNQVNEERASAGLDNLKWDQNLETVSSVRANGETQKRLPFV